MESYMVLVAVFFLLFAYSKVFEKDLNLFFIARFSLSGMLIYSGALNLMFSDTEHTMLTDLIIADRQVLIFFGIFEILAAVGLFVLRFRVLTGWTLILFFSLMLLMQIYIALESGHLEQGKMLSFGAMNFWLTIPFQVLLILWTYWSAVKWRD